MRVPLALLAIGLSADPAVAHGAVEPGGVIPMTFDPLAAILIGTIALGYCIGLRRRGSPVTTRQAVAFLAGCSVLFGTLASPLHNLAGAMLSMHMIQHLVLVAVVPPLLVAGRPEIVLQSALPRSGRRLAGRLGRATLRNPLLAAAVHGAAIWAWHAPSAFEAALRSPAVHDAEHLSFLLSAIWFWAAVAAAVRRPSGRMMAIAAILATLIHSGLLGALLVFSGRVLYPAYEDDAAALNWPALTDQQLAGLVMWVPGGAVYLAAAIWIAVRLLDPGRAPSAKARAV